MTHARRGLLARSPILVALAVMGCAQAASVTGMVPAVTPKAYRSTNRTIRIDSVMGGQVTHGLGRSYVGNAELAQALVQAVTASQIFAAVRTEGAADYALNAEILSQETSGGFTMRASLFVRYGVRDLASGQLVVDQSLLSQAEAGVSEAFYGPTRFRIVKEKAVRENLTQLLQLLSDSLPHTP